MRGRVIKNSLQKKILFKLGSFFYTHLRREKKSKEKQHVLAVVAFLLFFSIIEAVISKYLAGWSGLSHQPIARTLPSIWFRANTPAGFKCRQKSLTFSFPWIKFYFRWGIVETIDFERRSKALMFDETFHEWKFIRTMFTCDELSDKSPN